MKKQYVTLVMDRKRYGSIPGVTDKEYYTNSFHIPVGYKIRAFDKIRLEAPYHALTNAGHISYVELDGDMARNVKAFESVVRAMHDAGIASATAPSTIPSTATPSAATAASSTATSAPNAAAANPSRR